jgi:hypothetical protein
MEPQTPFALAFRAGEITLTDQFTDGKSFAATSGAKLITTMSCENGFLTMNTQTPPWKERRPCLAFSEIVKQMSVNYSTCRCTCKRSASRVQQIPLSWIQLLVLPR